MAIIKNENKTLIEDKRIRILIIKISLVCLVFLSASGILLYNITRLLSERNNFEKKVLSLEKQNRNILNQIKDLENKTITAKKYIEIWENKYPEEQKLLKGIDIEVLNNKIQKLAENTDLSNVNINFSPVIIMTDKFDRKTLAAYTTLIAIEFNALTDVSVFNFINDLENVGYFITIQEINLKRTGKVDDELLNSLSNGEKASTVNGTIKVRIYGLGEK